MTFDLIVLNDLLCVSQIHIIEHVKSVHVSKGVAYGEASFKYYTDFKPDVSSQMQAMDFTGF